MTEMKNGVRKRSNGTWEGRYYGGDGKQHSIYGGSKSEVKDKLAAKRTEISQGVSITETDLTVEQWGREWLDNFKANRVRHSTLDNYDTYFRLHIVPYIGQIKVKELTTLTVQRLYNQLEKKGLSPKSIHDVHKSPLKCISGLLHNRIIRQMLARILSPQRFVSGKIRQN